MPIYDTTVVRRTISPALRSNGTVNGAAAATFGSNSAIVVVNAGTITDGSHAVSVEESDTGTSGWTAVPANRLTGALPTLVAANSDSITEIGVSGFRSYLRATIATSGATTGGIISASIVFGEPDTTPVVH